jgi:hypothetical protein
MADETPDERNHRLINDVVDRARELVKAWDDDEGPEPVGDALLAVNKALLDLLTADGGSWTGHRGPEAGHVSDLRVRCPDRATEGGMTCRCSSSPSWAWTHPKTP